MHFCLLAGVDTILSLLLSSNNQCVSWQPFLVRVACNQEAHSAEMQRVPWEQALEQTRLQYGGMTGAWHEAIVANRLAKDLACQVPRPPSHPPPPNTQEKQPRTCRQTSKPGKAWPKDNPSSPPLPWDVSQDTPIFPQDEQKIFKKLRDELGDKGKNWREQLVSLNEVNPLFKMPVCGLDQHPLHSPPTIQVLEVYETILIFSLTLLVLGVYERILLCSLVVGLDELWDGLPCMQ